MEADEISILLLADIHGSGFLIDEIAEEIRSADVIVLSGDITHFGTADDCALVLDSIRKYNDRILAVAGNCDHPDVDDYLREQKVNPSLEGVRSRGFAWFGISGSLPCPGTTPFEYTEKEAETMLSKIRGNYNKEIPNIMITHQPPYDTVADKLTNGVHVGSRSIRNFIEERSPLLCLTGHIHEGIGTDQINSCYIVNPGPFRTGKYARIRITGENSVNIDLRQITA
jgi:Icc-related predicted phosphoesterase